MGLKRRTRSKVLQDRFSQVQTSRERSLEKPDLILKNARDEWRKKIGALQAEWFR